MSRLRVVVVEDHPLARAHLARLLDAMDGLEVVAACEHGMSAVEAIPRLAPDLVFLDIEMPEMSGFDVIEAIGVDEMPPVIFVTAHDMYALQAFQVHALDYVLKPLSAASLADVVRRARARLGQPASPRLGRRLTGLLNRPEVSAQRDRVVIRANGRVVFVRHDQIDMVEACGNYAIIHQGQARYTIREPLHTLEERLGAEFSRIHRSRIVNLRRVSELRSAGKGEYDVVLADGQAHRVTRRFRPALEAGLLRLR